MSYTKQTWANGDIITAAKLNHMEDGIAGVDADVSSLNTRLLASMPHDTASGSIASFPDGAALPVIDCSVAIEPVQAGSGDPSPDNVRPISGWTECKVTRTGINVWDEEWELGVFNNSTGEKSPNNSNFRSKNKISVVDGKTYYFYALSTARIFWYSASDFLSTNVINANSVITAPTGAKYLNFQTGGTTYNHDISINYPATDTAYHAYQGQTYTIDLDGTRYGGTLDVTTGKLTVNRAMVDLGTMTWTYLNDGVFRTPKINGMIFGYRPNWLCSMYIIGETTNYAGWKLRNNQIGFLEGGSFVICMNTAYTDAASFTAAMNGQTLVYELATPIEVQLTPTEITTLLGTNNIFADCGDTTVSYYADTTLFVNKKIAAAVAALS